MQPSHEYRSVNVGTYKVFFRVDEEHEVVIIHRIRYAASDFTASSYKAGFVLSHKKRSLWGRVQMGSVALLSPVPKELAPAHLAPTQEEGNACRPRNSPFPS